MGIKQVLIKCISAVSNVTRRENKIDIANVPLICCKKTEIDHIASSNNIITFFQDGEKYFFKECRRHTLFKDYIITIVTDYFKNMCSYEDSCRICELIKWDLNLDGNQKKFYKLSDYCKKNYSVIYSYNGWDTGIVGLPSLYKLLHIEASVERFMHLYFHNFIEYARNEVDSYRMNYYVKNGEYQTFRSSLSIATKKIADLLNISDMVPEIWYIRLQIDGMPERFGSVTKTAPGFCPLELSMDDKQNITPNFQRRLLIMNLFDVICFQRDHKQENYFIITDANGHIDDVCAFDNDSPMTFFPLPLIETDTCIRCSPAFKSKKYNRPFVDEDFYQSVINFDTKIVGKVLSNELSELQIIMLKMRIAGVKKIFVGMDQRKRISASDWSEETALEEIGGKYGKTYLKHFLECDEDALVQEIMNHP